MDDPADIIRDDEDYLRSGLTIEDTLRIFRAMMLAQDLPTLQALLRGESVPLSVLDPVWVARYGLKK